MNNEQNIKFYDANGKLLTIPTYENYAGQTVKFTDATGTLRVIPSTKETIGCASSKELILRDPMPLKAPLIKHTSTINDYLGAIGVPPSKVSYHVKIEGKKQIPLIRSKDPSTNLELALEDVERKFMRLNELKPQDMSKDVKYTIEAVIEGRGTIAIPEKICNQYKISVRKNI